MTEHEPRPPAAENVKRRIGRPSRRWVENWPWLVLVLVLAAIGLGYALTRGDGGNDKAVAVVAFGRVPNVVGLRSSFAVEKLRKSGYGAEVSRQVDPAHSGRVIAQSPNPDSELSSGSSVKIVVGHDPGAVEVPVVVGLPVTRATSRIRAAGLRPQTRQVESAEPKGSVVSQTPPGGDEAKKGSAVRLHVSKGPQLVTVPSVVGKTVTEATATLIGRGFTPGVTSVRSKRRPGTVLAQKPRAGARAPSGSAVSIAVAQSGRGPGPGSFQPPPPPIGPPTRVPSVVGRPDYEAIQVIQGAGFSASPHPVASSRPQGTVLSQAPKAGAMARRGSTVSLRVSGGESLRRVPNVVGRPEASARQILLRAGYEVQSEDRHVTNAAQVGIVVVQDPPAGVPTQGIVEVTIYVGRG